MTKTRLKIESELYKAKWFDYRVISPDLANLFFIRAWAESYALHRELMGLDFIVGRNGEAQEVEFNKRYTDFSIEGFQCNYGRDWKSFVRLRRLADKNCFEYGEFWAVALGVIRNADTRDKAFEKGETNHLAPFLDVQIKDLVVSQMQEGQERTIKKSDHHLFLACNYEGLRVQDEYYDYLLLEVLRRYSIDYKGVLERFVEYGYISEAYLMKKVLTMDK